MLRLLIQEGCILRLNTKMSPVQVSIKGADPDEQGETSIGGKSKQVKVKRLR